MKKSMRTHKYRAWDIKKKKMIYNPFVYDDNETLAEWSMVRLNEALKDKRFVYLEYTGLCDLNSKKIFEGDIIKIEQEKINYEVVWTKTTTGFWLYNKVFKMGIELGEFTITKEEVIGNIMENPKLLNKV